MTGCIVSASLTERPDGPSHGSIGDGQETESKILGSEWLIANHLCVDGVGESSKFCLDNIDVELAREEVRNDPAEYEIGVRDSERPPLTIASRARIGSCTAGTDLEKPVFPA